MCENRVAQARYYQNQTTLLMKKAPKSLAIFLLANWGCVAGMAFGKELSHKDFTKQYKIEYKILSESYWPLRGSCRLLQDPKWMLPTDEQPGAADYKLGKFYRDKGSEKFVVTNDRPGQEVSGTAGEIVYCITPKLSYILQRMHGSTAYSVQSLGERGRAMNSINMAYGRFINAPYSVYGLTVMEMIDNPLYNLVSAKEVKIDGEQLIEVQFEKTSRGKTQYYVMTLDPAQHWVIRSAQWQPAPNSPLITIEIEYLVAANGLPPLPQTVKMNGQLACEFLEIERAGVPESEFGLAQYGLPGLGVSENRASQWSGITWIVLAVFGCLLLSYGINRAWNRLKFS